MLCRILGHRREPLPQLLQLPGGNAKIPSIGQIFIPRLSAKKAQNPKSPREVTEGVISHLQEEVNDSEKFSGKGWGEDTCGPWLSEGEWGGQEGKHSGQLRALGANL